MSEIINNSIKRKEMLKHLIEELHKGSAPEQIKKRLIHLLHTIPYNEVVEVEQQLIAEGLPEQEIQEFCDLHTAVLEGSIDLSGAKEIPAGHPVDVFKQENSALKQRIARIEDLLRSFPTLSEEEFEGYLYQLRALLNELQDVDKHYLRKEYLLFPFLEKAGITGPPKVMWGKHDETRALLKAVYASLSTQPLPTRDAFAQIVGLVIVPALEAIQSMILKEEEILLPMSMDTLDEDAWVQIAEETPIYGFCLYDPQVEWKPIASTNNEAKAEEGVSQPVFVAGEPIRLSSGSFDLKELEVLFSMLPIDITFVDKEDKVKFFSHSPNRVFERNRSILGRDVRMCHPPHSVHIVEQIINDFKSGKENKAAFWISNFNGRFIHIEYTALRGANNEYLGVMEVTQDITGLRNLEGDQRLLSYGK